MEIRFDPKGRFCNELFGLAFIYPSRVGHVHVGNHGVCREVGGGNGVLVCIARRRNMLFFVQRSGNFSKSWNLIVAH